MWSGFSIVMRGGKKKGLYCRKGKRKGERKGRLVLVAKRGKREDTISRYVRGDLLRKEKGERKIGPTRIFTEGGRRGRREKKGATAPAALFLCERQGEET